MSTTEEEIAQRINATVQGITVFVGGRPASEAIPVGDSLKEITLHWDACHPVEEANTLATQIQQVSQTFQNELATRYPDPTKVHAAYILVGEHWSCVSLTIHEKA